MNFNRSLIYLRVRDPTPDFEDYIETTKNYCPKQNESICDKFKTELRENGIECQEERAERLKSYLEWKCDNEKAESAERKLSDGVASVKQEKDKLYPEHDLLPSTIRPNSYEIWLWVQKERFIKGNATIKVTING